MEIDIDDRPPEISDFTLERGKRLAMLLRTFKVNLHAAGELGLFSTTVPRWVEFECSDNSVIFLPQSVITAQMMEVQSTEPSDFIGGVATFGEAKKIGETPLSEPVRLTSIAVEHDAREMPDLREPHINAKTVQRSSPTGVPYYLSFKFWLDAHRLAVEDNIYNHFVN